MRSPDPAEAALEALRSAAGMLCGLGGKKPRVRENGPVSPSPGRGPRRP